MKHGVWYWILFSIVCFGCASSPASTPIASRLPAAPDGMEWKNIPELGIDIAMPKDWFYKWVRQGDSEAFFVTKENIDESGRYSTGLGVNINPDVSNANNEAEAFIASIESLPTTTRVLGPALRTEGKSGVVELVGIVIEAEFQADPRDPVQSPKKTLAYFAVSNTETRSLYALVFEAPRESWDSEWNEFGYQMIFYFFSAIDGKQ
jgi:hypothetical protein